MSGRKTPAKPRAEKPKQAKAAKAEEKPADAAADAKPAAEQAVPAIVTAPSRIRHNMDDGAMNATVEKLCSDLQTTIDAFHAAKKALASGKIQDTRTVGEGDDAVEETYERNITAAEKKEFTAVVAKHEKDIHTLEAEHKAYSACHWRFSKHTPFAVAAIVDEIVREMALHGMNAARDAKRKQVSLQHVYSEGLSGMQLYPLIHGLKLYQDTNREMVAQRTEAAREVERKAITREAISEFKKTHDVKLRNKAPVAEIEPQDAPERPVVERQPVDRRISLECYVKTLCKHVAHDNFPDENYSVSTEARSHIDELLREFLQRLSSLTREVLTYSSDKTIQEKTILHVVKSLLIDGHAPEEVITLMDEDILDPNVLREEEEKKALEKAKGRTYKIDKKNIPTVTGKAAVRTVNYPTSAWPMLEELVKSKLASI